MFAPTDRTFARLPDGTVDSLLQPANKERLAALLTDHVVTGRVLSRNIRASRVSTVNGQTVTLDTRGGYVTVDEADVITADVRAGNGVIHVIDRVILPAGFETAD